MEIIEKIKRNQAKKRVKFIDLRNEWLINKKIEIKESTYSNYAYTTRKYLIPTFKNLTIKELERYDYSTFVEKLVENLSPKTTEDIVIKLKSILNYANEEYGANIPEKKIKSPKVHNEPLKILSRKECERLEKTCKEDNSLQSIGILIALETGLRIGEICALKWKNVDVENRVIKVRQTLQRVYKEESELEKEEEIEIKNEEKKNRCYNKNNKSKTIKTSKINKTKILINTPKSESSIRDIPINDKLYSTLVQYKKILKDEDFVLTGSEEKYYEPRTYENVFKKVLLKSKIRKYNFHILRHTFATNCLNAGMDMKALGEVLGHSEVNMTMRYTHTSYATTKKYLEKI